MELSRYLIGVDLGTTNSVVAYIDTHAIEGSGEAEVRVLEVPQLVRPGESRAQRALPSFLYFPTAEELEAGTMALPGNERPKCVAGALARDYGALLPTRQVASAKSWLCNNAVDRTSKILPRDADPPLISPVEASAKYLEYLRLTWNRAFAAGVSNQDARFEHQEIVLTVPASFDEEARELTVDAARQAGLQNFALLEEPLAAFYAWTASQGHGVKDQLNDGELVLICDIGGGTTDLSLVRAEFVGEQVQFERKAIGEHLLLGGDNLDLALAHRIIAKLKGTKLGMRQRHALQRVCGVAKEQLLSSPDLERVPITVLGSGRQVVGQVITSELLREEVVDVLANGFLPFTAKEEMPKQGRSAGLRELGLPYAGDPAITKHVAAFLRQAAIAMKAGSEDGSEPSGQLARPDAILFNGGFCEAELVRERIVEAIGTWFADTGHEWRPKVLDSASLQSAVAKGAAHYGRVRRGDGSRIRAGSARTYYVGLRSETELKGVCVLPSGVDEGTKLPLLDREFVVRANRPVSFNLYSSRIRHDSQGQVTTLEGEDVHQHAPLVTLLRYGKKMKDAELSVRLRMTFTELGTLELWCEAVHSPHRWRLQFELRGTEPVEAQTEEKSALRATGAANVPHNAPKEAITLIRQVFERESEGQDPDTLTGRLEAIVGTKRDGWTTNVIREFADGLIDRAEGRKLSPRHEIRWANLVGFCLRPGFGVPGDDERVRRVRAFSLNAPAFQRELQCEVEWLVLLRRICGGFNAAQQHELYRKVFQPLRPQGKRAARINAQVEYDSWRLLASLEYLPANVRVALGDELIKRISKNPDDTRWLWPLARIGSRVPLYGPLSCVVPAETVAGWISFLIEQVDITPELSTAIVYLGRRTGDGSRDIEEKVRSDAVRELRRAGAEEGTVQYLERVASPERADAVRMFGESLPRDLHLVSSVNCLLSLTALTSGPEQVA